MKYKIKFKGLDKRMTRPEIKSRITNFLKNIYKDVINNLEDFEFKVDLDVKAGNEWNAQKAFWELYKDNNGRWIIDIDHIKETVSKYVIKNGQKTYRDFIDKELEFFDGLGFHVEEEQSKVSNQSISDWF